MTDLVRLTQNRKAGAFASYVSRVLSEAGHKVLGCEASKGLEGIRVKSMLTPKTQLPAAKVWLDFDEPDETLTLKRELVANTLRANGFHIFDVELDYLLVQPHRVNVILVPSSDGTKSYLVRIEDYTPVLCTCNGFVYRLTCRHLAEALKNDNPIPA